MRTFAFSRFYWGHDTRVVEWMQHSIVPARESSHDTVNRHCVGPTCPGFIELYNLEFRKLHTFFIGAGGIASSLVRNGQGNTVKRPLQVDDQGNPIPHGFNGAEDFQQFGSLLRSTVPEGTQPLFQGSAVTGSSYSTGKPFDVGRQSDFDIALAGSDLFEKAKALNLKAKDGTRIGPLSAEKIWRILDFRFCRVN